MTMRQRAASRELIRNVGFLLRNGGITGSPHCFGLNHRSSGAASKPDRKLRRFIVAQNYSVPMSVVLRIEAQNMRVYG